MDKATFTAEATTRPKRLTFKLLLLRFQDENDIHFVYSPHLDLSGYGYSYQEAQTSFEHMLSEFLDYTSKKGTLALLLKELGWKIKGSLKHPSQIAIPSLWNLPKQDYLKEIFDKYPISTTHQEVKFPAFA